MNRGRLLVSSNVDNGGLFSRVDKPKTRFTLYMILSILSLETMVDLVTTRLLESLLMEAAR